jgi:hypothetical protein
MVHEIHRVTAFERLAPLKLRVRFEDGTSQVIDFGPVLNGEIYRPLRDPQYFDKVRLDEEAGTLTWPNGADFEPATLHDWQRFGPEMAALAETWTKSPLTTKP